MACDLHGIGQNAVVADDAIVRNVHVGHEQAVATDAGFATVHGAAVHGHALPNHGVVADYGNGLLTGELQVLGHGPDHGTRKYLAILPDAGTVHDGHVRPNPSAFPDFDICGNGRKRFNGYARRKASRRVNIGEGGKHSGGVMSLELRVMSYLQVGVSSKKSQLITHN